MPTVSVRMLSGRTPEQKRNLVDLLTRAVVESLDVKEDVVKVELVEFDRGN